MDRVFFYREYTEGISTAIKQQRLSRITQNITTFNQNYRGHKDDNDADEDEDNNDDEDIEDEDNNDDEDIEDEDDNDDEDNHEVEDNNDYDHSMKSSPNHLVEGETSDQEPQERDQIALDASSNTNLTSPRPEVSDEISRLFDCLINVPHLLAYGDTAKLLSYCKVHIENLPNTVLY
jgi:hypothetical protein